MKRPNFFEGVVVGIIASIAASALFTTLVLFFNPANTLELIITGISFGYILYLLARSHEKTGRIIVLTAWGVIAALVWILSLPLTLFIFVHVALIWLIRSLYFYSSILSSLIDMGLTGLSLAVALWAGIHTSSLFLSIWCIFLIQALFVTIPVRINKPTTAQLITPKREDAFESAHRSAENALRKLSTIS